MASQAGPETQAGTRCDMLLGQVHVTSSGLDAEYSTDPQVKAYLRSARMVPASEPGWFWIPATPAAARAIRRRGLHARGSATTTFIPPQFGGFILKEVGPEDVPLMGSLAWSELMIRETRERERGEAA
jgi:hypothetical protein